ncbi:hypothetical protein RFN25_15725 [Mesorhizobium abyssinicae]|uniref:hypothetical protein n=1 Tax=Mesorhizobium abyssinicae TaxID=1209958 RepID=UPI002A23BAD4|nr:hypothetical protein [Mesorhizobium abyssinicae]MDX8434877.1 hypothetical protein [Mesorhizobium abyssinicae]
MTKLSDLERRLPARDLSDGDHFHKCPVWGWPRTSPWEGTLLRNDFTEGSHPMAKHLSRGSEHILMWGAMVAAMLFVALLIILTFGPSAAGS